MQIGKTLYVQTREEWRKWLRENHAKESEIWFIFYRKATGKTSVTYSDAVEEALCFGWIDSIVKGIDDEKFAQKFSRRKPKSNWSELNKERMKKLIKEKKMTTAGLSVYRVEEDLDYKIPADILKELKKDKTVWNNFQKFSKKYQRVRIAWIDGARKRPKEFQKRLKYFLKMTKQNKQFGLVK